MEDPVTVTAYFTENLPPQLQSVKQDFQDLLIEYGNRSGGNVVYEFINPNEDQASEQKAMQEGIQPIVVNVRESDQMIQQRAYMGAKIQQGDASEVIPALQPGAAMEFALSSAIKKIAVKDKPKIGFVTGHGEAGLRTMQQVVQSLETSYEPSTVTLNDTALMSYMALAIITPTDSFNNAELAMLDRFLEAGKGISHCS